MTQSRPDDDLNDPSIDENRRRRIAETLGSLPRAVLSALVDYGLTDEDIAEYHGLPRDLVAELRGTWHIPPMP
ncbi:hypothetical protein K7H22_17015 [Seohaeicola saemankumensis]|uniref:hypothetical protein n=1 Tax=Seohaeicola saemankumensis TaxID=481181 RepID=UPI001E36FD5F|nr:hypothetical protein [Seohaeicola saemankumensis]MCD1627707.1 hypothetical protein [Seohaeicola saemankumensis]